MSEQAEQESAEQETVAALSAQGRFRSGDAVSPAPASDPDGAVALALRGFDTPTLRNEYVGQGAFLYLSEFLPPEATAQLAASARALLPEVNRNYLPGHKQGGSVSRHAIDRLAPFIAQLYRSPALLGWLEKITGDRLQLSPDDDPHAYALYYYTRAGDHIGWHYDTSYYDGRRYTLLLGVIEESSCRLEYELHTRNDSVPDVPGSVQYPPGSMVLFDGDALRHRVTPAAEGDMRVSLTFEYVTDPNMRPWRRFVSNMKDAIAYFGFRQVFSNALRMRRRNGDAA
ncbi:HalD/BesD family halogenase [Burkholderia sp. WAC0059]|uniref:HalD/BesD family halogenase n=1 Tax=Burkholderia sp. WAC0059 TaxID=2066022 RepID=UPI002155DD78|nr:2OG-Fe(II) oxygenase [Burkholderia sp. WAC0059]